MDEDDIAAVVDVLRGEWLTTGPAVQAFEEDLAGWTGGVPTVAVTSGTAALHVAYAAGGVGPGSEVVTSPLTFVATAATAMLLGGMVVFADVEADTGNLDVAAARAAVSPRTSVLTAVDYAGHPAELDDLAAVAHEADALLVEDASHSLGAGWNGRPVGSIADLTTFSFFATKNITTAEGGAVAALDPQRLDRARRWRNHGLVREPERLRVPDAGAWHQEVHEFGLNYRLPDVLCALGSSQLRRLDAFKRRRAEIVQRYNAAFEQVAGVSTPVQRPAADPVWHLYPLRVHEGRRRGLFDHLRSRGILVQVNYLPAYWHPAFADLGYQRGMCPAAEAFYEQQLSLPLYPGLTDAQVDRVVDEVTGFLGA